MMAPFLLAIARYCFGGRPTERARISSTRPRSNQSAIADVHSDVTAPGTGRDGAGNENGHVQEGQFFGPYTERDREKENDGVCSVFCAIPKKGNEGLKGERRHRWQARCSLSTIRVPKSIAFDYVLQKNFYTFLAEETARKDCKLSLIT